MKLSLMWKVMCQNHNVSQTCNSPRVCFKSMFDPCFIPCDCVFTWFVSINKKHHLLNYYLLIKLFTLSIYNIQQANSV